MPTNKLSIDRKPGRTMVYPVSAQLQILGERPARSHACQSFTRWPFYLSLLIICTTSACELSDRQSGTTDSESREQKRRPAELNRQTEPKPAKYKTLTITGQVVWAADLLKRRFDVSTVAEAKNRILALETEDGTFYPIVEDVRGRSFRTDERLRKMKVELLVRRHHNSPMIQIVRIHEINGNDKFVIDYWCDECSIVMLEQGPCDCCQDNNRLRKRLVDK